MKKALKVLGFIALVAVIGFLMVACGGGGDDGGVDPTSVTYVSYDAAGNIYTLVITKSQNQSKAVYVPKSGDTYFLTIKSITGDIIGTSTGTVNTVTSSNTSSVVFTLEKDGVEFIVSVGNTDNTIEKITGKIPVDSNENNGENSGEKIQPPVNLTPTKPISNGTLEVSRQQVYTITENQSDGGLSFTPYTMNRTFNAEGGIKATITNGKLSFTLEIPENLELWNVLIPVDDYASVTATDTTAKGFIVEGFSGEADGQNYFWVRKGNVVNNMNKNSLSETNETLKYVYVDKDVTISGTGKTITMPDNSNIITKNFNLALKEGWNALYIKEALSVIFSPNPSMTVTTTISLDNPPSLKWIIEKKRLTLTYGDYNCSLNADESTLTIVGYTGAGGNITLPSNLNERTVTGTDGAVFRGSGTNKSITGVTIPNTITSIGMQTFLECSNLVSITIPSTVTSIGLEAFYNTGLTSVTFQGTITSSNLDDRALPGDLRAKYLAEGPGTYTTSGYSVWTKQ